MDHSRDEVDCPSCGFWVPWEHAFSGEGKKRACEVEGYDGIDAFGPGGLDRPIPRASLDDLAHQSFGGPTQPQPWRELDGGEGLIPDDPPGGNPG